MNLNLRTDACNPDRLESFLSGVLNDTQEREFVLHLNSCENCRRQLERQAAEPEVWREADQLLKPSEFDSLNVDEDSDAGFLGQQRTRQPLQIQSVLDALKPTDDPQMLGRLGGYEVSAVVGAGGMGVVLKAIDKSLDRTVAIKVLAPHLASSGAARKRFAREAKAAAAVLHANVIAIHSVSNDEVLPYLVMPYVRGTSLQKRLDKEGPLSLNEILRIGSQIAAGLAAAHAQGLVHRDIKPANILLEDGIERVTITDFGLARAVDDATITHSGVIAGTPQYMSPEQARGEAMEQRSDLFSLGSVLYATCTGRPPFRAETTYGVMRRITDDEPTSIREINPDIPVWLCSIIAKLMSKRASDRFDSAAEVAALLEDCLAHVQQPASAPLPATLPRPAARRGWRLPVVHFKGVPAMIAASIAGLLGILLLSATPPDIAGEWSGEEWGQVVLKKTNDTEYTGTYSDTFGEQPGEILLKWSRVERQYTGTWHEGDDRFGEISLRLVGDEIRGAHTTDAKSKINPATPRLAGLMWTRPPTISGTNRIDMGALSHRVPFEVGATLLRNGDQITIDEVRGTADTMEPGNMYEIKGTYRLASQAKATLLAEVTGGGTGGKEQRQRGVPTQKTQWTTVERGEGKFALILYMWHHGSPHISFYPDSGDGGFAHVYFGTGNSVLKKGWWEDSSKRDVPISNDGNPTITPPKAKPSTTPVAPGANTSDANLWNQFGVTTGPVSPVTAKVLEWIGLHLTPISRDQFREKNVLAKYPGGLDVTFVRSGDHAEKAGIHEVDIVVSLQQRPLTSLAELDAAMELAIQQIRQNESESLEFGVLRGGETVQVKIPFPVSRLDLQTPPATDNSTTAPAEASPKPRIDLPKQVGRFQISTSVNAIAYSPDGNRIAIAIGDPTSPQSADWKRCVKILDAETGKTARTKTKKSLLSLKLCTDEEDAVFAATEGLTNFLVGPIAFSPDGTVIAVGTFLGQVKLFNAQTGERLLSLDDELAKLAEKTTPEKLKSLKRAMGQVSSLAFSPDGSLLAMTGSSFEDEARHWGGVRRLGELATGPGRLKVWDAKTGTLKQDLVGHSQAYAVTFSPDGKLLASAGSWLSDREQGTGAIFWDPQTGTQIRTLMTQANGGSHAVIFSRDSKLVAIGSWIVEKDNTASTRISLAHAGTGIMAWQKMNGWADPKTFSSDGKSILTVHAGKSIQFIDAETGTINHEIKAGDSPEGVRWTDCTISPNGNRLAISGDGPKPKGTIEIWDIGGSAVASRYPHRVPFETGRTQSQDGGRIEIREVWGTRPLIEVGGQYLVRGKYSLPPGERGGKLYFYATAGGDWGKTASLDQQSTVLDQPEGEFELTHGMAGPGYFHLTLTDPERYSRWFADVYFGTGDNVYRAKP